MEFILLAVGALYLFFPKLAWKWGKFNYYSESNIYNKDLEKMLPSNKTVISLRLVGCGVYGAFWNMNRLPKGDLIMKSSSPDGRYIVKAYLSGGGGATTDFAIRAELVTHTGVLERSNNIYWNYHEQSADIKWIEKDTLDINGHILDLPYDKFDFRNQ
jgi:hypothetical protein